MSNEQTPSQYWTTLLPRLARYLPPSLFNQLRDLPTDFEQVDRKEQRRIGRELIRGTRALDPLQRVLMQYMPRYLVDLDPVPGQPHGELLQGSYLWADMTGFTALTELLSKQGAARGPEAMNQIMNRLFNAILDPLTASGGDLLIFAGDAVLAHFPKQENDHDVWQAVRAGLRMQRAVAPFAEFETDYGWCSLTMSLGVDSGEAYAGVVGSARRMELLVSGPGIHGATHAEESGEPGQVIVGPQALPVAAREFTLKENLVLDDLGDELGDYEIPQPKRKAGGSVFLSMDPLEVLQGLDAALQRVERLAPFLPEDMLAQMVNTDRHRKLESELRPVAVQFINIVGIEDLAVSHGPELATEVFQRYFVQAQEIINKHEGVVSQIDAYGQGFFLLNTFGVPKAHEGTRLYAVSAALQLAKVLDQVNQEFDLETPIQQRGGITHGLIFSGEIGAQYRRESFVGGPAVNRAARLMGKAEFGQVILDSDIWAETQAAFVGEQLPAVYLKGIEGQVVIVNVHDVKRGTRLPPLERSLVGREAEREQLQQGLEALFDIERQGCAWMISGESGIGKTSLVSDLALQARQKGVTVLAGRSQPHGKHIPLFPWVDLLVGWLDVGESTTPAEQREHLHQELARLGLADLEVVLADLLELPAAAKKEKKSKPPSSGGGLPGGGASLLSMLSGKLEEKPEPPVVESTPQPMGLQALLKSRLADTPADTRTLWTQLEDRVSGATVIINLLRRLAQEMPLLIILEDVNWLDDESSMLLNQLLDSQSFPPFMLVLTGRGSLVHPAITSLPLNPLPDLVMSQIVERGFGGQALQDTLAVWINNQAGGNPLYATELCQALQQSDAIFVDRGTGEVRWTGLAPALPLSLHELLLSRFDELPTDEQDVLKWGAVIGQVFEYEGLIALGQKRLAEKEVQRALRGAVHAGFVTETRTHVYRFNHPLMLETIYETLAFSQRQTWHTQVGDWLVEERPEMPLELKAYHYLRGEDSEKGLLFGYQAANRARELGAYIGAYECYEQILSLSGISAAEQLRAAEGMADVLTLQGDYSTAMTGYIQAIDLGSPTARQKLVLLSGDLNTLRQTDFVAEMVWWAAGSQAWLMAQNGDTRSARQLVEETLKQADGMAQAALEQLVQKLISQTGLGIYDDWLAHFAQGMLVQPEISTELSNPKSTI